MIMDIIENPNYYFSDKPYKPKLICCDCRKVFKRRLATDIKIDKEEDWSKMVCPNCGKQANYVGPKFRAPKSDNIKAWKSIEILNDVGALFFMGFAANKIIIPESNKALVDLLTEMKSNCESGIKNLVRHDYSEKNKEYIKAYSDMVKKIDKHLHFKK
jgi:hypothetical protein